MPTPAAAPFTEISVTHLNAPYDESRPVFIGHRLPLRLGITSRSARPLETPRQVTLNVSLIEHADGTPDAARLAALRQCFVRTVDVELNGTGEEQLFEPTVEIPRECLPAGAESVTYNVVVQVDTDERALAPDAGRAWYFTDANRTSMGTGQCRSSMDVNAAADGCVHRFIVRASPGTDLSESVSPNGRVALFWLGAMPGQETRGEMMSIQVDRRAYGHEPFDLRSLRNTNVSNCGVETRAPQGVIAKASSMDSERSRRRSATRIGGANGTFVLRRLLSSADADRLPGMVTQRIRIAPATGAHAGEFQPLRVQADTASMPPTETRTFDRLLPAADNRYEYDLFPTEEVLRLITEGDWRDVNDFTIEACLEPTFEERGEEGDILNDGEEGVRAQPAAPSPSAASRLDLNREWSRHFGNDRIGLDARFNTENYVIVGGAVSDSTGRVAVTSRYLPDLTLFDARAYAGVDLFQPDRTGLELRADVFGVRALSFERRVPESRELYNRDWSVMRRQCKSGRVTIGPIPIALEGCMQGTLGLNVNAGIYRDGAIAMRRFADLDTEGQLAVTVTPYVNAGGSASVSIDVLVARAGVEGQITVLDVRAPVTGSANVGLRRMAPMTNRPAAQANLNINWQLVVTGLRGRILLFADTRGVRICRKRVWFATIPYPCGITWDRRGDLTLFSFGADPETFTLLDRTFANFRLAP